MNERGLLMKTTRFLSTCIDYNTQEEPIPTEFLRNYIVDLFKCLEVGDAKNELGCINEAIEAFKLAEKYIKEPPVHDDWIEKPTDLEHYWTWERCVEEGFLDKSRTDENCMRLNGVGSMVENVERENGGKNNE
jgi:hypothetical protein